MNRRSTINKFEIELESTLLDLTVEVGYVIIPAYYIGGYAVYHDHVDLDWVMLGNTPILHELNKDQINELETAAWEHYKEQADCYDEE